MKHPSQKIEVHEMPQPPLLFAGDLLERTKSFMAAFEKLMVDFDDSDPYATYYIGSHVLELGLKAYLASKGTSKKTIRSLNHKIVEIFDAASCEGLPKIPDLEKLVDRFSLMNNDHDFRYPSGYALVLPEPKILQSILRNFWENINAQIKPVLAQAQLQFASDTRHLQGSKIRWSD